MSISNIIILFLLLVILICLGYILYLNFFRRYTRERFAFLGTSMIFSLSLSLMTQVYSNQGFISTIINALNYFFKANIAIYKSDYKDHIIIFLLIALLSIFFYKMYKTWNGPISEQQFEKDRYSEKSSMVSDWLIQFQDFFSKEKIIKIHDPKKDEKPFFVFSKQGDDRTPWFENVCEYLRLTSSQYKIDIEKDFYHEQKVFISKFGQSNEPIAIFCSLGMPTEISLKNFITFTKKENQNISRFIVAVKGVEKEKETKAFNGIELEFRFENELLNNLIDFNDYKEYIKYQFETKEISEGSNISLKKFYVPLSGLTDSESKISDLEQYVLTWLEEKKENKHLAILAEYGCGKSVFSLRLTHLLLNEAPDKNRIPILIELRGKSPRNLNVLELISTWSSNFRIDPLSLLKLHNAGKLLLIFEGFDEMDMIGDKEMRLNHFQRLWEFAIPKSKIIITGRPNFFLDDKELKTNLGIEKPFDSSHFCEAIHLEKFSLPQIEAALRGIDLSTKTQILTILKENTNQNFFDLVSRPAILYLVSVIWNERKLSAVKEKINSAYVISEFIKYSYSRQSSKSIVFPLTEKEREFFMLGMAIGFIHHGEFTNQLNKANLEIVALKLYKSFPESINSVSSATQPKIKPLKTRLVDNNDAEETILTDIRSCGIIVKDLSRKDYFKFAHKSFLEYLASFFFVEQILQDRGEYNIATNAISSSLSFQMNHFNHSQETMLFTSEILIQKMGFSSNSDKREICKKLFQLLYPIKVLKKSPYIASYCELIFSSRFIFFFLPTLLLPSFLFRLKFAKLSSDKLTYIFSSISLFVAFIITMSALVLLGWYRMYDRIIFKRTLIWLKCCIELNIDEKIMKSVVPKIYLLYIKDEIKNRILNFILRKSRRNFF